MTEGTAESPLLWLREMRSPPGRQNLAYELRRLLRGRPVLPPEPVGRVLVVCHGNICRSPFAAALLSERAPWLEVRGAGLATDGGAPAEPGALRAARRFGVDLGTHRSRPIDGDALAWADLVLGMEGRHVAAVRALRPEAAGRAFILGEFAGRPPFLIPDPWGRPDAVFERTFRRIDAATSAVVAALEEHRRPC